MVLTVPSAFGFQVSASPVPCDRRATRFRGWPPMLVKLPPAYRSVPSTASALTTPLASGSKLGLGSPVLVEILATLLRSSAPITEKSPPTKMFAPDTARARTVLFAFEIQPPFAAPDAALSFARRSRGADAI